MPSALCPPRDRPTHTAAHGRHQGWAARLEGEESVPGTLTGSAIPEALELTSPGWWWWEGKGTSAVGVMERP